MNSISVHASGRLALSTSTDSTLRLWNLVKGKCAHTTTLSIAADQVAFAPSGDSYGLVRGAEARCPLDRNPVIELHPTCLVRGRSQ